MQGLSYLAFAAGYRRISFVLIENGQLATWQTSCKAAGCPELAACFAEEFIDLLRPNVIVMEDITAGTHKGKATQALLQAIANVAAQSDANTIAIQRERLFRCRYTEAEHLARLYPDLADKVPKRRFFDPEPHHTVLFGALALADQAMRGSALLLASKM